MNYGQLEDYETLQKKNVNLTGKIVIARYGNIWRGAKAQFAQQLGAIGVIIYNDPYDYSENYTDYADTFPNAFRLPPKGAQRGAVTYGISNGDFPTPFLPAKSMRNISLSKNG